MLFPLLFTAACNLQAVFSHLVSSGFHGEIGNLFKPMRKPKIPMNTAIETIEKCSDA